MARFMSGLRLVAPGLLFAGDFNAAYRRHHALGAAISDTAGSLVSQPGLFVVMIVQVTLSLLVLIGWKRLGPHMVASWWWPVAEGLTLVALLISCGSSTVSLLAMFATMMLIPCGAGRRGTLIAAGTAVAVAVSAATGLIPEMPVGAAAGSDLYNQGFLDGRESPGITAQVNMVALSVLWVVAGYYAKKLLLSQGENVRLRAAALARRAATQERIRTAQEVHDGLSSTLTGAHLMATTLARRSARWAEPAATGLGDLVHTLETAIRQSRSLLLELRQGADEHAPGGPPGAGDTPLGSRARVSDLAILVRILAGTQLLALIMMVVSPASPLYNQMASLLPVTMPAVVVMAGFAVVFLVRWEGIGHRIAETWWWPSAETLGLFTLLLVCGPQRPIGTMSSALLMLLVVASPHIVAVVTPLAVAGVTLVLAPPQLRQLGLDAGTTGGFSFAVYVLVPVFMAAGIYARRILILQGEAARERVEAESRDAAAQEQLRAARAVRESLLDAVSLAGEQATEMAAGLPDGADQQSVILAGQLVSALATAKNDPVAAALSRADAPPSDLADVCRTAVETMSRQAPHINVTCTLPDHTIEVMAAARHDITQALSELLENVRRHSQATAVRVSLARHGAHVTLQVSDNGIGLPDDADLAELRAAGHFGLAGVQERVARIDGHLHLEPARPGTTAMLTFSSAALARGILD